MTKKHDDRDRISISAELARAQRVDTISLSGKHAYEAPTTQKIITSERLNRYILNFYTENKPALEPAFVNEIAKAAKDGLTPKQAATVISQKVIEPLLRAMDRNKDGFITLREVKDYYKAHPSTAFTYAKSGDFYSALKP